MTTDPIHVNGVTLELLLDDAAVLLEQAGVRSIARAVQFANTMITGHLPAGESFVADVVEMIESGAKLASEASIDDNGFVAVREVEFERFADAVGKCQDWGLTPEVRTCNALRLVMLALESIATLSDESECPTCKQISDRAERTLDALGFYSKRLPDENADQT